MDYLNGRSMELLRRLDLAAAIGSGDRRRLLHRLPLDPGFCEQPVMVWHHPSVNQLRQRYAAVNDGSAPVEPYQRLPRLGAGGAGPRRARSHPLIDLREGWTFSDVRTTDDGVTAQWWSPAGVRHAHPGALPGACDGAGSGGRRCVDHRDGESCPRTLHCFRSTSEPGSRAAPVRSGVLTIAVPRRHPGLPGRAGHLDHEHSRTDRPGGHLRTISEIQDRVGPAVHRGSGVERDHWEGRSRSRRRTARARSFCRRLGAPVLSTGGHGANTGIADAVDLG